MKNKRYFSFLLVFALLVTLLVPLGATTVSADEPTAISDQAELAAMTASGNYVLANDITISGTWSYSSKFTGSLDGAGYTVTFADGASISGGLFQQLGAGATVRNLKIKQAGSATWSFVKPDGASSNAIGALAASVVGNDTSAITVYNVSVNANIATNVASDNAIGGLLGEIKNAKITVERCKFEGSITDSRASGGNSNGTGGIIGMAYERCYSVSMIECVNEGTITGFNYTGGLMGIDRVNSNNENNGVDELRIERCVNRGNVTVVNDESGGGIIGRINVCNNEAAVVNNNINYGSVSNARAEGNTNQRLSGICGRLRFNGAAADGSQHATMSMSGNINYGTFTQTDGTHSPILDKLDDKYRINSNFTHTNNFSTVGNWAKSSYPDGEGNIFPFTLISETENGSAGALADLNAAYPGVYTITPEGIISLAWEVGDLAYLSPENYRTRISLTLDGLIRLRFGVEASCAIPDGVRLIIAKNGKETDNLPISDAFDETSGYYVISIPILAKEMADRNSYTVTLRTEDRVILTEDYTLSVKQYAEAILADEIYSNWHSLMRAMLDYGAAAQNLFDYNTETSAADLSGGISLDQSTLPAYTISGDRSFLQSIHGSLVLEAGTDLNLYFKPENANAVLSASVRDSGGTVVNAVTELTPDGFFAVRIQNLSADRLDELFEITVSDGEKQMLLSYSGLCWVKEVLDDSESTSATKLLAKGIGVYAGAAKASMGYSAPILFASEGVSSYYILYEESASDYFRSTILSFVQNMKRDGVAIPVATNNSDHGKPITLVTSGSVNGWKIDFAANGAITVTGETELLTAAGFLHFVNVLLKKGLNGDYMIIDPVTVSDPATAFVRDGWLLAAPAYEGGTLASRLYNAGTGMSADNNEPSGERSFIMCVSETTAAHFRAYTDRLVSCGFELDSENDVLSSSGKTNMFREYRRGMQLIYLYFNAETEEVRIIEDRASVPASEFEYTFDYDSNTPTELYSYGMKYDAQGGSGALQMIKQADGSVFLIDGGSIGQATSAAINGLWQFLHTITGKAENETIVISCWFITHPHGDHYALVSSLLETYHDKLDLQRVMFNFPNRAEVETDGKSFGIDESARSVLKYYPNARFFKCHTGQSIRLGSVVADVMITHEDAVDTATGKTTMPEGNSMTTVIRFTFADGTRYLELGDFTGDTDGDEYAARQDAFVKMYADSEFRCDIILVAHHGYNLLSKIYPKAKAAHALWTNRFLESKESLDSDKKWKYVRAGQIRSALNSSGVIPQIHYAAQKTTKLECRNGAITVTEYDPVY